MDAYFNLGLMHEEGLGVRKNIPEAIKWYQKAAHLGDEES
ncbi:SEL1-like repeat protein, partial [Aliarcobacter butzleri]